MTPKQNLWRKIGWKGQGDPSPAWLRGFIEGATEVWNEVKDRVDAPLPRVQRRTVKRKRTKNAKT